MISVESLHRAQYKKQFSQTSTGPEVSLRSSFGRAQVEGTFALPSLFPPSSVLISFHVTRRKWAALMVLLSPPRRDLHPHLPCLHTLVCSSLSRCSAAGIMLRAVLFRSLPTLRRLPVCHYSAAAIPAPSTQPEVHYNKVESLQRLLLC